MLDQVLLQLVLDEVIPEVSKLLVVLEAVVINLLENIATLCLEVSQVDALNGLDIVQLLKGDHQISFAESEDILVVRLKSIVNEVCCGLPKQNSSC